MFKVTNPRRMMMIGLVGTIVAAMCCLTPLLVSVLAVVGLGALTGYLDFVLLPALLVFIGLFFYGALGQRSGSRISCCEHEPMKHD
ncbi:MAG: mercury resistance system transport protein MerF [Nitrospirae bacterium]|nr:MAG: mercury resistance system transport protein MerF [Nitrospirota bacterium]